MTVRTTTRVRWGRAGVLLALAATSACGSTVAGAGQQLQGAQASGALGGLGPSASSAGGLGGQTSQAGPAGATNAGGTTSAGSVAGAAGGSSLPVGSSTASGTGVGEHRDAAGVLQGPGVTATSISIGMGYVSNGDAANAAIGASGISQGDPVGEAKAVIADINAHGGAAHRTLVPIFHPYDAESSQTDAAQDEGACSDYTQDHKVFAVADLGLTTSLPACLAKAGVLQVFSGDIISHDGDFYRQFPHFTDLGTMTQDRMMSDLTPALTRQAYFDGWNSTTSASAPGTPAKVGVLSVDDSDWNTPLEHILLPALARAGHPVAGSDVVRVPPASTTSEEAASVPAIQNAALRFRSDGVTHVILLDPNGTLTLFFTKNANGQHYYPRYGVDSGTGMQALVDAGDLDPAQLKGALGIGWLPQLDLPAAAAKKYDTPAARHCLAVLTKAGFTFSGANDLSIGYQTCDQLYFLADVINGAGSSVVLGAVQVAIDRVGAGFIPANLPAAYLSAAQHDAVTTLYDLAWNASCTCAVYTDGGHRSP